MVTRVEKPAAPAAGDHQEGLATESLDDLAKTGLELDKPAAPKAADVKAEQQVVESEADELAGALKMLRALALPFAPDHVQDPIGQVWNDGQLKEIARCLVEVCRLHGLTIGQLFEGYGPYINLLMALGIPALATIKILRTPAPAPHQVQHGQQQPA